MKKVKVMALTLAASVMIMGAGYAYWADSVKIDNTVNTGNLDVYFSNISDEIGEKSDYVTGGVTYKGTTEEPNGTAEVTLGNMYPGATANVKLVIKNASSIPVSLDVAKSLELTAADISADAGDGNFSDLINKFEYTGSVTYINEAGKTVTLENGELLLLPQDDISENSNIEINYSITAKMSDEYQSADDVAENRTLKAKVTPVFKQYNHPQET